MTDNSNPVLPATGVAVRSIDRPNEAITPPPAVSGVTQVVQLDQGGARGAESLVSPTNPLQTQDVGIAAAQSSDSPLGVFVTGDPNGDFAGVNIIEQLVDDGSGLAMNVKIIQPPFKVDANGALVISDGIPIVMRGVGGSVFTVDTQGYAGFTLTTQGISLSATLAGSNDLVTLANMLTSSLGSGSLGSLQNNTFGGSQHFAGSCYFRYLRFTLSAAGQITLVLRSAPTLVPGADLRIGGVGATSSNALGTLAVGGGSATGAFVTTGTHPIVAAGADQNVTATGASAPIIRQLRTDSAGRLVTAPLEDKGIQQALSSPGPTPGRQQGAAQLTTLYNNTAANVQDTTQIDGASIIELLAQILLELRIANQQRYELPLILTQSMNTALQQSNAALIPPLCTPEWDEPAAFRAEPSIFNQ